MGGRPIEGTKNAHHKCRANFPRNKHSGPKTVLQLSTIQLIASLNKFLMVENTLNSKCSANPLTWKKQPPSPHIFQNKNGTKKAHRIKMLSEVQ